jgi:hypothetical protein
MSHKIHTSNAARQQAYRNRNFQNSGKEIPVTVPSHVDPEFVNSAIKSGVSVGFAARKLKVSRKVVRACLTHIIANDAGGRYFWFCNWKKTVPQSPQPQTPTCPRCNAKVETLAKAMKAGA